MTSPGSYKKLGAENLKRIEQYVKRIEELMSRATGRFISLSTSVEYDQEDGQFFFANYPQLKREIDRIVNDLAIDLKSVIASGTTNEWANGSKDAGSLLDYVLETSGAKTTKDLKDELLGAYLNNHDAALRAFQQRAIGGMNLSQKVWDLSNKSKIESELARSIAKGTSASEIAESMKEYLKKPNELYRRVRDEFGNLHLSKRAAAYHPEPGVYRSSYKNALRLARTEINMSYRNAEWESWQEQDYVVGIQIHRSNTPYDCEVCASLEGRYPKNFKWNGWHPNCRCYMTPILLSQEEREAWTDAVINGEEYDATASENYVADVPDEFKEWVTDNRERILQAEESGTLPYFLRDNSNYVVEAFTGKQAAVAPVPEDLNLTPEQRAMKQAEEEVFAVRDSEEINQSLIESMVVTEAQKIAINKQGWGEYGYVHTPHSFTINSALRENKVINPFSPDKATVDSLDAAIAANSAKENIVLYRFQSEKWASAVLGDEAEAAISAYGNKIASSVNYDLSQFVGKVISDAGFSSTSLSFDRNYFRWDRPICLEIKTPAGTNLYVAENISESEVILKRGQKIIITGYRFLETEDNRRINTVIFECIVM